MIDRYGDDVLAQPVISVRASRKVPAEIGLVVEDVETGWCGAVIRIERTAGMHVVVLEDRHGRSRSFPLGPGFWIDGQAVELVAPQVATPTAPRLTASGSIAADHGRARVARASRIWVEGRHDAELVEKVWGADLRELGIVVEMLDGADHLADRLLQFAPGPGRRVGVLLDHLVPGSKESKIAEHVGAIHGENVLVVGHPFVDVWQGILPARVGLSAWPKIPRHIDWKRGILAALGRPSDSQSDIAQGWQWLLSRVRDYRDLAPEVLGRVEQLIDFITVEC